MYVTAVRVGQIVASFEVTAQSGGSLTISGVADGYTDAAMQSGDTLECRPQAGHFNEVWALLTQLNAEGGFSPSELADSVATNGSLYFSATQSKLAYKDAGGTVHTLY
jgi:hypothetical protein